MVRARRRVGRAGSCLYLAVGLCLPVGLSCGVRKKRKKKRKEKKKKRISHRLAKSGSEQSIHNLHGVPRTAASIKLLDGLLALTLPPFDFSPFFPPAAVHVGSSSCNLVFECFTLGLAALIGMGGAEVEVEVEREREEEEGSG